ncbi:MULTISPECIES: O-antigen ligase family protein [unclassified Streptomyces]
MIVLAACAGWALVSAAARDGRPEGVLLAVLALAAGYASGRICGALLPVAAPCAGALAGLGLALAAPHITTAPALLSPLGHTGATAALLTLSAGAACCASSAARSPGPRLTLFALAAATTLTALLVGSTTGFAACVGVLLCSLAGGRLRHRALGLAGLGLTAALVAGTTWAIAENALPEGPTAALEGRLTEHRVLLWQDALGMVSRDPGLGAGPGRFGELSATAALSPSPDGKPHSAAFQQAAEQGVVGVALLAVAFGWVLYALWRSPRSTPVALSAGAALTALAAIAAVGNALSFTTVTAGAGLLAGIATARPLAEERDDADAGERSRGVSF